MSSLTTHPSRRYALMRAHTATHLLHASLCTIFPNTKQAWSYVGEDELRFDFFADRLLDAREITQINDHITMIIREHYTVTSTEMPYQNAIASGAKAFFEDKYPELVRVVTVQDNTWKTESIELCGGTHVSDTGQIGAFIIIEQSAVAAGIKRISAITGPRLTDYILALQSEKITLANKVGVSAKQLDTKIEKLVTEHTELTHKVQKLSNVLIAKTPYIVGKIGETDVDIIWSYEEQWFADTVDFAEVVAYLRSLSPTMKRLLHSASGQYALFHPQAKEIIKKLSLKWWWSENFVQGMDTTIFTTLSIV